VTEKGEVVWVFFFNPLIFKFSKMAQEGISTGDKAKEAQSKLQEVLWMSRSLVLAACAFSPPTVFSKSIMEGFSGEVWVSRG